VPLLTELIPELIPVYFAYFMSRNSLIEVFPGLFQLCSQNLDLRLKTFARFLSVFKLRVSFLDSERRHPKLSSYFFKVFAYGMNAVRSCLKLQLRLPQCLTLLI
jgi:hypothetical protein